MDFQSVTKGERIDFGNDAAHFAQQVVTLSHPPCLRLEIRWHGFPSGFYGGLGNKVQECVENSF